MKNENNKQIQVFNSISDQWWSEDGLFKALHEINVPRLAFIQENIKKRFSEKKTLSILDIGCGGGLLSEPLSRLGYKVTGLDTSSLAIEAAKEHAKEMGLSINYVNKELSAYSKNTRDFDVVTVMELLEHVPDPAKLLREALECLKPDGLLFFSTLNRTWKSWFFGIKMAENVLKWAPKGAHSHNMFIKPSELQKIINAKGFSIDAIQGISYKPLKRIWELSDDLSINYLGVAKKDTQK